MSEKASAVELHRSMVKGLELTLKLTQTTREMGLTLGDAVAKLILRVDELEGKVRELESKHYHDEFERIVDEA